jgi:energy-coupling factor transporter transmembrane protein EcfT
MASVVLFHFIPGQTVLHKLGLLPKLFSFILFTSTIFLSPSIAVPAMTTLLFILSFAVGENPLWLLWRMRLYLPFFLFLFLFGLYSPSGRGDLTPWFESKSLFETGMTLLRYLEAFILSHLLLRTTSYKDWRDGLFCLFKPLSVQWADTLSLAVTMTLHFIPLFMDEAVQILEALKVRFRRSRTPLLWKLKFLGLPLLLQVLLYADQTGMALESRGQTPWQTRETTKIRLADILILTVALGSLILSLIFKST